MTVVPPVPGAAEAARLIGCGALTAVEHVEHVLASIDATQQEYAAWAHVDRRGALLAAARADEVRAAGGRLGPLHGVAIGVKDVIPVAGMPMRAASRASDDAVDTEDAAAVACLRAAGAVIVGKTTTHEFASGQGDPGTRSPLDPARHPGGSSVGSAVAVALRSVPATLGTDTTGSVRNPSAANGVVGFKASNAVDTRGLLHFSHTLDAVGPIAPSVEDCWLVMAALTGGGRSALEQPFRLAFATPTAGTDRGFHRVLDAALEQLRTAGFDVVECRAPDFAHSMTSALVISLVEVAGHHARRLGDRGADYLPDTRRLIAAGALLSEADEADAHEAARVMRRQLADLAATTGAAALVGLTLPSPQPLLANAVTALTAPPGEGSLSAGIQHLSLANLTGAPAMTVPAGASDGHPVGLHLLGLGSDADLLEVGAAVERHLPARP